MVSVDQRTSLISLFFIIVNEFSNGLHAEIQFRSMIIKVP